MRQGGGVDGGEAWRYSDLAAHGWSREVIRKRVREGILRRPSRGVYTSAVAPSDDLQALFLRLPAGSVLAFGSAAQRYGLPAPTDGRHHIIVPPGVCVPRIEGVAAHASVRPVRRPVWLDGVPCVPPERCAIDLARRFRRVDALPLLDATLRAGLCTAADLAAEVAHHAGRRGSRQARDLISLADPRAECVQESQLRLLLIDNRLPWPEPQMWVRDRHGAPVYRLDLGYYEKRVGIEYDGASHSGEASLIRDRSRHNWLADHGWRMRYFTARDLYRAPATIVSSIAALLGTA